MSGASGSLSGRFSPSGTSLTDLVIVLIIIDLILNFLFSFLDPYEETKLKILDGQRLETPEFTDLIDHGDTVYR